MIINSSKKDQWGRELIQVLLDHNKDIPITEDIILAALASSVRDPFMRRRKKSKSAKHLVQHLFARNSRLQVTADMLKAAKNREDLEVLLAHASRSLRITPDILEAVALDRFSFEKREFVLLLLAHDKTAKIPESVLRECMVGYQKDSIAHMTVFLKHDPNLVITAELLKEIVTKHESRDEQLLRRKPERMQLAELLLRFGKRAVFTNELREALNEEFAEDPEVKELFYGLEKDPVG